MDHGQDVFDLDSLTSNHNHDLIDLCSDDDHNDAHAAIPVAVVAPRTRTRALKRSFESSYESSKKISHNSARRRESKRIRRRKDDNIPNDIDIIDCDTVPTMQNEDPSSFYRQFLGPLRMDFISCFVDGHYFQKKTKTHHHKYMDNVNKVYKELLEFKLNLPIELSSSIFVRALEDRMDLLRVLITGPEGTPYANGCFFFDVRLTKDYPKSPPKVQFLTTGGGRARLNPNLYECGKVCLSLLGTWSGPGWQPNKSTLLQVLISIQGLILVPDPFYNEPGYETYQKTASGKKQSQAYNAKIRQYTLEYAMNDLMDSTTAYPEFADVITRHFVTRADAIKEQLTQWGSQDSKLKKLIEKVRTKLNQLVQLQDLDGAQKDVKEEGEDEDRKLPAIIHHKNGESWKPIVLD